MGKRVGRPSTQVDRNEVVVLREAGLSYRAIAKRLRISPALAQRLARDQVAEDRPGRSQTSRSTSKTEPRPAPQGGAPAQTGVVAPEGQETNA